MDNLLKQFETKEIGNSKQTKEVLPVVGPNGDFYEVRGKNAIVTQIQNLLTTPLGTYPFDPEYGTLLYKQLFETIDSYTEQKIYYEVKDRIMQYIDNVTVDSVSIEWDKDNKACHVYVDLYLDNEEDKTKLSVYIKDSFNKMYDALQDPEADDYRF